MLRLGLGIILSLCVGGFLVGLVRGPVDSHAPPSVMRIVISAITFQGAVLILAWRCLRENGTDWTRGFGFGNNTMRAIGWGVAAVLLALPLCWALQGASVGLMKLAGIKVEEQLPLLALRNSGTLPQLITMGFVTVVLAPLAEEILFRGIIYPAIRQYGLRRLAAWSSSLLFAAMHVNLAIAASLFFLATVLVWLYEKTDNLAAPIAAHVAFNAINFTLFLALDDPNKKLSF